jgi:hypothetical protein
MVFAPKLESASSFCEQEEAKKLFIRSGDSAFSRAPPLQGE